MSRHEDSVQRTLENAHIGFALAAANDFGPLGFTFFAGFFVADQIGLCHQLKQFGFYLFSFCLFH